MSQIQIQYHFENLSPVTESSIKEDVQFNLDNKMDAYLKKVHDRHPHWTSSIHISISKHAIKDTYEGTFNFLFAGEQFVFKREGEKEFESPKDLVHHAFDKAQRFIKDLYHT